ncbi:Beta-mannosyltransferase 3 [Spathaspora sp. JA1]|nr:Beta-mannosyltransferase 3 [Spathaspora sp. JA1]
MFNYSIPQHYLLLAIIIPLFMFTVFQFMGKRTRTIRILFLVLFLIVTNFVVVTMYSSSVSLVHPQVVNSPISDMLFDLNYKTFKVPAYSFIESNKEMHEEFECSEVQFQDNSNVQASTLFELNKPQDLKIIRDQVKELSKKRPIYKLCLQDSKELSEQEILDTKWFKFCGSSVWLDKYNVHFMVNRIVYTTTAHRNSPTVSMLAGQIFDNDWNEITNFTFPNSNLTFPTVLPHYIDPGEREIKNVLGAEDPRIILHEFVNDQGEQDQEPLIVFNSRRTNIRWNRAMHVYRPLHDSYKITMLNIKNKKRSFREKNWAPFIDSINENKINFVYNFNPLRIIRCELDSGECDKVSGPDFNKVANSNAGALRGGTNIVKVPENLLPEKLKQRSYWFGIARSHIDSCGCLHVVYRPHAFIMSRPQGSSNFTLDYVSSLIDFNINPETWNEGEGRCSDGKSVLIPNSIAYWNIDETTRGEQIPTDYMGITFSEADKTNRIVHIKGWLAHILKTLDVEQQQLTKHYSDEDHVYYENQLLGECATYLAQEYCKVNNIDLSAQTGYLALITIFTPFAIFFVHRTLAPNARDGYKQSRYTRFITVTLYLLILFLNLNAWYFCSTKLDGLKSIRPDYNSPIGLDLAKLNFENFKVPGYSFIETGEESTDDSFKCTQVEFHDVENLSASPVMDLNKDGDLKICRDQLRELSKTKPEYKDFFLDRKDESEESILSNKWWKFCGSAVWLEKYNVHFMVNRIVYAKDAHRSWPTISVLSGQVFDRDWNELTDFKFPNSDLKFPGILPHFIDQGPEHKLEILGAEDPRVVLHEFTNSTGQLDQEPLIVFNSMRTEIGWKRAMHVYRPLKNPRDVTRLHINGLEPRAIEKNWAPFIDGEEGTINFIYNFHPLRILKCNVDSGECNKVSGPDFNKDPTKNAGKLRGGTNIVPIPSEILPKKLNSRKYWFGIGRSHSKKCGCVDELYRPHAFILSRPQNALNFTLDYVSSLLDFNMRPDTWNGGQSICHDGKSVLIPNSISYWDFENSNNAKKPKDYMGITFSTADMHNKLVHVKGWLPHIYLVLDKQEKDLKKHYADVDHTIIENKLLGECSTFLSKDYCEVTAKWQDW